MKVPLLDAALGLADTILQRRETKMRMWPTLDCSVRGCNARIRKKTLNKLTMTATKRGWKLDTAIGPVCPACLLERKEVLR